MNWTLFFFVIGAVIFTAFTFCAGFYCGYKIAFLKAEEIVRKHQKKYLDGITR